MMARDASIAGILLSAGADGSKKNKKGGAEKLTATDGLSADDHLQAASISACDN
jgi:hypothetical protein